MVQRNQSARDSARWAFGQGLTVFSHQSAGVVAEEYAAIKSMIHWASPVDGREFTRQEILLVCLCFSV